MYKKLFDTISAFNATNISEERKAVLHPLIRYIRSQRDADRSIRLNFICTHNSRRSHLSQIWAQTLAFHYGLKDVYCYSGGTEATALFLKVAETLSNHGFLVTRLSESSNPVFAIKYAENEHPVICFSKEYHHAFNPASHYGAILTCNTADEACPLVMGAEEIFPIKYDDPKAFDGTDLMDLKYAETSLLISGEMKYVFSQV